MAKSYDLTLTLVPAADDPEFLSPSGQRLLNDFYLSLHQQHIEVAYEAELREGGGATGWYLGEFFINLAAATGPVIGAAIGAWLQARYGRKVRVKIGDIEAEAHSAEEVEKLLAK